MTTIEYVTAALAAGGALSLTFLTFRMFVEALEQFQLTRNSENNHWSQSR